MTQADILSAVSFAAQYAHETDNGRETLSEAWARVEAMHRQKFKGNAEAQRLITEAFEQVNAGLVFPSQRSTQFGGEAMLRKGREWRIYNCTASYCDRPRFFAEYFWLLLMGCGCGVSIQKHHIERLPELITADELRSRNQRKYLIEDSIEGWAEAALELILSYMPMYQYQSDCDVIFLYDQVRPAGSPISSGGRTAGPEPLRVALDNIRDLLTRCVQDGQRQLKPIDAFDICGFLSDAVLSGGVRRSASIMLFSPDDTEMMEAKTGDWWQSAPWRATANISALIAHDPSLDELTELLSYTQQYGEPAVFFSRPSIITNPCAEIGLKPVLDVDGEEISGWQACNLTEIVAPKCSNVDAWLKACKAAAILGTLQAAYTDAGYLLEASRLIVEAEALIGVSITGICGAPDLLTAENLEHGASVVKRWNQITADAIGINAASRLTCVKPSGNSSVLAGCSAGAHPWHSKRFIRRMRLNKMNPVWKAVSSLLPDACEDINDDTGAVMFALEAPEGSQIRSDLSAVEHMRLIEKLQRHWVAVGSAHDDNRVPEAAHSVSCTVTVKEDEWHSVAVWMHDHIHRTSGAQRIRGISWLSDFGDTVYQHAPYEEAREGTPSAELWNKLAELDWSIIDLSAVSGERERPTLDPACVGGTCLI